MDRDEDRAYIRLQQHLNRQAVGFPATKSGAEIRILKHIFTPREAEIATCMTYRPEPLEKVYERAVNMVGSPDELAAVLGEIQKKGGVEISIKDGKPHYCNPPLIVGMFECQVNRLTPAFLADVDQYVGDRRFGLELLSTKLPQMRTIPVGKSIRPHNHVGTFDQVNALLQQAEGPFGIIECICRKKKRMEGHTCKVTDRKETCMPIGSMAASAIAIGTARQISREEAIAIMELNQKEGLVLQPSNTERIDFVCSCCGCCCGMLGLLQWLPRPLDFWATNFHAEVDANYCNGCGACVQRCQLGAVSIPAEAHAAVVDLNRCIGCGHCVSICAQKAVSLWENASTAVPPKTREDLYDVIMANRLGTLGKIKLMGKLTLDSIRSGQTGREKS